MTAKPVQIAFHVGVHKTATSHLQRCLKKASGTLAENGVRYYGPEAFRDPAETIPAYFGFRKGLDNAPDRPDPLERLATLRQGAERLVLSEENFIGALNSPRGLAVKRRYKPAEARLTAFSKAIGQRIDIFMAVRRPTSFINSAYGQMLLGGQVRDLGLYLRRNPLSSVDWFDLVKRIRGAKGVGRLTVWRYEDYAALFPQIVSGLVGDELAPHVQPVDRKINSGLSAAAVAEVLHRSQHDPIEKHGVLARKMLSVQAGYPPFDAYSAEEHDRSDAVYASQIAAISKIKGVTLLRP